MIADPGGKARLSGGADKSDAPSTLASEAAARLRTSRIGFRNRHGPATNSSWSCCSPQRCHAGGRSCYSPTWILHCGRGGAVLMLASLGSADLIDLIGAAAWLLLPSLDSAVRESGRAEADGAEQGDKVQCRISSGLRDENGVRGCYFFSMWDPLQTQTKPKPDMPKQGINYFPIHNSHLHFQV